MKLKYMTLTLILAMITLIPTFAYTPPTSFEAPSQMSVQLETVRDTDIIKGFKVNVTLPDALRQIIEDAEDDSTEFFIGGYYNVFVKLQLDFRYAQKSWSYTPDWNGQELISDENFSVYIPIGTSKSTSEVMFYRDVFFEHFYPELNIPTNKSYFDTNFWIFRSRFIVHYNTPTGISTIITPWSKVAGYDNYQEDIPSEAVSKSAARLWQTASPWAEPSLEKAQLSALIPEILYGTDMTQPITREEFAELLVHYYESMSGIIVAPTSQNPFLDTTNPVILKAYALDITSGITPESYGPERALTREQTAVMLYKTLKVVNPYDDFPLFPQYDFVDATEISPWATEAVNYLSHAGIMTGNQTGAFMPKPSTAEQLGANYGVTTREQAIAMIMNTIK